MDVPEKDMVLKSGMLPKNEKETLLKALIQPQQKKKNASEFVVDSRLDGSFLSLF